MPSIAKKEIPAYVRKCYDAAHKANIHNREAENERLRFYVGGDLQWRDAELTKRRNQRRPWVTINRCKAAVDQIEGDIRLNPPGPQVHPVGGGADADTADIIEGLIRETEYRSIAKTAYSTAGKYSASGGYAVIELATEFSDEHSFSQRLKILSVEDPSTVFFDPTSRMANRQDAAWAGKLKMYTESDYKGAFGANRRVLQPRGVQNAMGWIQDAMGVGGDLAKINEWTGGGKGPYYVAEFYMVDVDPAWLRLYSDNIARFDDEPAPPGVKPKPGDQYSRMVPRRKVVKYVVDALEILDQTDWLGTLIPLFPVLGPEVYIDGKLHRLSLISGAMDSQRALNYVATTATEIAGAMPKAPWVGYKGQFDDPKWQTANSEIWAYLEVNPVYGTAEATGQQTLLPPPQRNQWEAPIQWLLALAAFFGDSIKAVTAIYDPSLGQQKSDQSGKAIEQLRSESNVGNFSYADNLHRAIEVMYGEMCCIFPKILDGPRVATIVKPDSQHEMLEINREFPNGIDPATGKKGKANNICMGQYSVRVTAGPNFQTRQEQALAALTEFFKAAPQTLAAPGVAAKFLRMVGEGNPQVEGMADLLEPNQGDEQTPQQLQQQLGQAQQQNQALTVLVQKMHQAIQAQLPKIEADKWKATLQSLTSIRVAEINASKDLDRANADRDAATLEHLTGMAHEVATQAVEHSHAADMQADQQQHASDTQASDQAAAAAQQQAAAEQEPTGATQ